MVPIDISHFFGERTLSNHCANEVECERAWIAPEPRHHTTERDRAGAGREEVHSLGAKDVQPFPPGFDDGSDVAHPGGGGSGDG